MTHSSSDFTVTERRYFLHGTTRIVVEVENTSTSFRWRMSVNDDMSEPTGYYAGLLVHKGFGLATAYWEGSLPVFSPFMISTATEVDHD